MLQWLSLPWVNLPSSLRSSCKLLRLALGEEVSQGVCCGDSREVWDLPCGKEAGPAFRDWG